MKIFAALATIVLSAATAGAAYLVELDGGEKMTVESYWEDGGKVHLKRGGVDLIVPKSRVRSMREESDDALPDSGPVGTAADAPATEAAAPAGTGDEPPIRRSDSTDPDEVRRDLEHQREDIERALLRAQRARFEAKARGEDASALKSLDAEFKHQQQRRITVNREIKALDGN